MERTMYLSKSKYTSFWKCPKLVWMDKYMPDKAPAGSALDAKLEEGSRIGELAKGFFGSYTDVSCYEDGKLNLGAMIQRTKEEIEKGTEVICEAGFSYNGLYCAVDILKKTDSGWALYEVKSSSAGEERKNIKNVYLADIAYQKYVLEKCGINLTDVNLVQLNKDYIYDGALDVSKLFYVTNVSEEVVSEYQNVEANIEKAQKVLVKDEEPSVEFSASCANCKYWNYCSRAICKPSVFDLNGIGMGKAAEYYKNGIVTFEDARKDPELMKKDARRRQIETYLEHRESYVDVQGLTECLQDYTYPLYFLDFETLQIKVPEFVGTSPFEAIPFQYSLHYVEKPDGDIFHREFLGISGEDPRRALAEQLVYDIPRDVKVVAYNMSVEKNIVIKLANQFPDLKEHLLNISENIIDLLVPFRAGYYYKKEMGGSFSIKSVLPAMFPDDPSLDYHNLEGVHHGVEAMEQYAMMKNLSSEEQKIVRRHLLDYCCLDTYALVKVWKALLDITKGENKEMNNDFIRETKEDKPVLAICYDFDKTLSPDDMQAQGFIQDAYGEDIGKFWQETGELAMTNNMDNNLAYMFQMKENAYGRMVFNKKTLEEYGAKVKLFNGVDTWFERIRRFGQENGVIVEHYILSSGLKEMIEATVPARAGAFKKIYANSFYFDDKGVAIWPAQVVNYTNKTQFLFRIEKGVLDVNDPAVNDYYAPDELRIPFRNMVYIGDSETDVPCMKLVNSYGGHSIGVYNPDTLDKTRVYNMIREDRIRYFAAADYSENSELEELMKKIIRRTAMNDELEKAHFKCVRESEEK